MESLRYRGPPLGGFIDDDGQEEYEFIGDVPLAFYGELPLAAEIPFKPGLGMWEWAEMMGTKSAQ
jgi:hypothetical protein